MDQQKIGAFLKQLRKEKNLTQEELAEKFYVSPKTISRWETGSNMPDLAILIELAEFYEVDIRNLIDGERKIESVDNNTLEALKKAIEYEEKEKANKKLDEFLHAFYTIMSAIILVYVPSLLFGGPTQGGYLYGKVPYSLAAICVWITFILSSLLLSAIYFHSLKTLQKDYVKKEDVKKYTIIDILASAPITITYIVIGMNDLYYGFIKDPTAKTISTILIISGFIICFVFLVISAGKSNKAWKAKKEEEESQQNQE